MPRPHLLPQQVRQVKPSLSTGGPPCPLPSPCHLVDQPHCGAGVIRRVWPALKAHPDLLIQNPVGAGVACGVDTPVQDRADHGSNVGKLGPKGPSSPARSPSPVREKACDQLCSSVPPCPPGTHIPSKGHIRKMVILEQTICLPLTRVRAATKGLGSKSKG